MKKHLALLCLLAAGATSSIAQTYQIEPGHTYPSFEADHMGISIWRGKFNKTSGTVTLDRKGQKGSLDITIDAASIDFGHDGMNKHARGADLFNVEKHPTITYKSNTIWYKGDVPTRVRGDLTLLGVTKPVTLNIHSFKCIEHPMLKKEVCGADASGNFKRSDFGMTYGLPLFSPNVTLKIQVEALKAE